MQPVPIVFGADARYGRYLPVVVQSILDNAAKTKHYRIIVFNCGILDPDIALLKRQIAQYQNFSFEVKSVAAVFEELGRKIKNQHLMESPAMLAPLFIPQLCAEYGKVIYADMDMIFSRDIAELMQVDLGDNYIAAVTDAPNEVKRILQEGDKTAEKDFYINSGLVLFNIEAWNKNKLLDKAVHYLVEGGNGEFFDQAAINFVCKGHIVRLGTVWNNLLNCRRWFPLYDNKRELKDSPYFARIKQDWLSAYNSKNVVYHWTGWAKPWLSRQIPFADIWWHYAKQTERFPQFSAEAEKIKLFAEKREIHKIFFIPVLRSKAFLNAKKYYIFGLKSGHIAEWRVDIKTGNKIFYLFGVKLYARQSGASV